MATKKAQQDHLTIPLHETQQAYQAQAAGMDGIKTTIRTVFASSSLIVSLVAALQLLTANVANGWLGVQHLLITAIAVLYVLLIILCVVGMWPVLYNIPLPMHWDVLTTTFQKMTDHEMTSMHLSAILQAIELNRPIVKRFMWIQRIILILLPLIVLLALLLAWIPRA